MDKLGLKIATIATIAIIIFVIPAASSKIADNNVLAPNNTSNTEIGENGQNLLSVENKSNEKFKDKTNKQLISEFEKNLAELNELGRMVEDKIIVNYSDQELNKLKSEVEQLNVSAETKDSLLDKVDAAIEKNSQASQLLSQGNEKQAKNMLNAENNILKAFKNEVNAQNGKEIATGDAEKLNQHVDKIIKGIEEGPQWILQENPDMKTIDPELISKMTDKITTIREILGELKSRGVNVDVKVVDASELQNKSSTNKSDGNGTTKVKAIAPVIVIVIEIGGEVIEYVIESVVAGTILGIVKIALIEAFEGPICADCEAQIIEHEIIVAIISGGIIKEAKTLLYLKYGLGMAKWEELLAGVATGEILIGPMIEEYRSAGVGNNCDDPTCIFYKGADLRFELVEVPDYAHLKQSYKINTTVANRGENDAGSFVVNMYVNTTPTDEFGNGGNFTCIGAKIISSLGVNDTAEVQFDWTPTYNGTNFLKFEIDPYNQIRETNEENNAAGDTVYVLNSQLVKCDLYKTKVVNSTSDPSVPFYKVYYFKAERPVLLQSWDRTPTFMYTTGDPVYSPVGFQAFYPYGGIWQYYADSEDGPWNICFFNPYAVCEPGVTQYNVDHWAMGSGYHQYFAVLMCTTPGPWESCQIKTELNELWLYDKVA